MSRLVAGPWVGEFGWELMSWQAYVRKRSLEFDETYVCGPAASAALYADFVTSYIPFDTPVGVKNCWCRDKADKVSLLNVETSLQKSGTLIKPFGLIHKGMQKFVRFGTKRKMLSYDVVVHARKPIGKHPEHSYSQENWDKLVASLIAQGLRVAAIGTEAFLPDGAADSRGMPLDFVLDLIASCKFTAGPSSGPTLLSLLCGTPVLVWTDKRFWSAVRGTDRQRIETIWNPFGTASLIADELGWDASPEQLLTEFKKAGDRWL